MGLLTWTIIGIMTGWLTNQIIKIPIHQIRSERLLASLSGALTGGFLSNVLFSPRGIHIDFSWQSALISFFGAGMLIFGYFLFERHQKLQTAKGRRNLNVEP